MLKGEYREDNKISSVKWKMNGKIVIDLDTYSDSSHSKSTNRFGQLSLWMDLKAFLMKNAVGFQVK